MKFFIAIYLIVVTVCGGAALKQGERCDSHNDCDTGLQCQTCIDCDTGRLQCEASPIQPLNPLSKVKGMPFNRYSWLATRVKSGRDNVENFIRLQLKNGVRGFVLELYDFNTHIWLCRSTWGKCNTHLQPVNPVISILVEIRMFLEANPSDIVTIMIEDYVATPNGITNVFNAVGLGPYWLPVSLMPENGMEWLSVNAMVDTNRRLLVFSSNSKKEFSEGIPYKWKYFVENEYGDDGMINGCCTERAESSPLNTRTRSLVLMNYFPSAPDLDQACKHNSKPLKSMMYTCFEAAGQRWPNFIVVDSYKRSDGGVAAEAVDEANGHLLCGCANIAHCKDNMTFGNCELSQPAMTGRQRTSLANLVSRSLNLVSKSFQLLLLSGMCTSFALSLW